MQNVSNEADHLVPTFRHKKNMFDFSILQWFHITLNPYENCDPGKCTQYYHCTVYAVLCKSPLSLIFAKKPEEGFFSSPGFLKLFQFFFGCFFTPFHSSLCTRWFSEDFLSHLLLTYEPFKHKKAPNSRMNQCSFYTYYTLKQMYLYH